MSFDNPVFIFLIIVAAVLRWLSKRSETTDEPERPNADNDPMFRGNETHTEEERIRRFLEALGQPTGTKPPPRIKPKRRIEPKPFGTPTLPPLKTVPPPVPIAPKEPPPTVSFSFPEAPPLPSPSLPDAAFEVRDIGRTASLESPSKRQTITQLTLLERLRSPGELRNAIILREIFGPPRGLQTQADF